MNKNIITDDATVHSTALTIPMTYRAKDFDTYRQMAVNYREQKRKFIQEKLKTSWPKSTVMFIGIIDIFLSILILSCQSLIEAYHLPVFEARFGFVSGSLLFISAILFIAAGVKAHIHIVVCTLSFTLQNILFAGIGIVVTSSIGIKKVKNGEITTTFRCIGSYVQTAPHYEYTCRYYMGMQINGILLATGLVVIIVNTVMLTISCKYGCCNLLNYSKINDGLTDYSYETFSKRRSRSISDITDFPKTKKNRSHVSLVKAVDVEQN
ncbi:hypothetical protein SNEBB_005945 [Seison nebaliae]|nr:hypothetical protein SNEBB_005945 [Seison nebaliae]